MSIKDEEERGRPGFAAWGAALAATAAAALLATALDLFEHVVRISRKYERWELDEVFTILFIFGLSAIVLLSIRSLQLQREMQRRRQSERVAQKSAQLLDLAQRGAGAGRWDLDLSDMGLSFCERGRMMLDLAEANGPSVTTDWINAVETEDRSRVWNRLGKAAVAGSTFSAEYRVPMTDGSVRWIETFGNVILDAEGNARRITGLQFDVTERKEAAEKLRHIENQLIHLSRVSDIAALASSLAHELNQPFTAISNYARGSLRAIESPAGPQHEMIRCGLTGIEENAIRAGEIIRRLREMIKTGEVKREPVQIGRLIEEANDLALLSSPKGGVKQTLSIDSELLVQADPIQVQQVVFNLVRNALESMEGSERRELTIAASGKDDFVQVSVADTGPGLSPERRQALFQPFSSSKPEGLGVGLSICRTIIEAHGGHLWADESDAGARFCFTLPVPPSQAKSGSPSIGSALPSQTASIAAAGPRMIA